MAVNKVRPGEIVEVPYLLPGGVFKPHPSSHNTFVKAQYFDKILEKTFRSIFDVVVEF